MKKRILALCLAFALALSLSACGSSSTDDGAAVSSAPIADESVEPVEDESTDPVEDESVVQVEDESEEVAYFSDVFNGAFLHLAENASSTTFDSCRGWLDAMGYDYTIEAEPDSETMGVVTIQDDNGFHLTADFMEADYGSGVYYIYLLSYGNGDYEGSVRNYTFSGLTYGTFDSSRDPKNVDVESLDDVVTFITVDVAAKLAQ